MVEDWLFFVNPCTGRNEEHACPSKLRRSEEGSTPVGAKEQENTKSAHEERILRLFDLITQLRA